MAALDALEARFAIIIPTWNAGRRWACSLAAIAEQSASPHRKLIIDSGSIDDTVDLSIKYGFEVKRIRKSEFNHGGTRQLAAEYVSDCEFLVFLTQDAILANSNSLATLLSCFSDPAVAVAYGRQIPHLNAKPMEAHARLFSYGDTSQRKDIAALGALGAKVFFCSNSFAAYRRSLLLELGGFRADLILGEDAEFAARAVLAGYGNFYCSDACVRHSHDYGANEILRRYFDMGVFHARAPWLRERFGSYRGEGLRFVISELKYIMARAPLQMWRVIGHTVAKVIGYRLGRVEKRLPLGFKRFLSMAPGYWRGRQGDGD